MVTKVVIAAAGQGTRMLSLSSNKSKHLINVKNRPFLAYLLDNLIKAGYDDIILVVGFKKDLMEEFKRNYLEQPKSTKVKIRIVDQYEILGPKEKEYGTACPVKCVKDLVDGQEFIYVFGDNLFSVEDLNSMNIDDDFCYIAGIKQEHPEKYGVLIKDGGDFLEEIIEKPKEFVGDIINAGLYKFTPDIFDKLSEVKKSIRGEYEITDAISLLSKERKVKIRKINDFWRDFGNPDDIKSLSDFIKNGGNKVVAEGNK